MKKAMVAAVVLAGVWAVCAADAEMKAALEAHMDYVKNETLSVAVEIESGTGDIDLNGHKTGIVVKKI